MVRITWVEELIQLDLWANTHKFNISNSRDVSHVTECQVYKICHTFCYSMIHFHYRCCSSSSIVMW